MMNAGNTPLRIAVLTNDLAPYKVASGPGELYRTLAEGLGAAGHHVTVIGVGIHNGGTSEHPWGSIVSLDGLKPPLVPRALFNAGLVAREILLRRSTFDVVECASWPGLSAFVFGFAAPVVVRLITSVAYETGVKLDRMTAPQFLAEWLTVRRATMIIASTHFIGKRAEVLYHCDFPRARMIPLGIADVMPPQPAQRTGAFHFLIIAGAMRRKGTDVLIRALVRVAERTDAFKITMIGPGLSRYDKYVECRPDLKPLWTELILRLGTRLHIAYDVSEAEKLSWLAWADYVVVTSRSESFGLPVIEAMRSSVAVIASSGGALAEVAGSSSANVVYGDPEDSLALANVMLEAIERGREDAIRRGVVARRVYEANFSVDSLIAKTLDAYREAIASRLRSMSRRR